MTDSAYDLATARLFANVISESIERAAPTQTLTAVQSLVVVFEHKGAWIPVARLTRRAGRYIFQYTTGALQLGSSTRAIPFKAFPKLTQRYESRELFPLFAAAIPGELNSAARQAFLAARGLEANETDPMTILAVPTVLDSGGTLLTLPNLRGDENHRFDFKIMLRGPAADSLMAKHLHPGQPLWLSSLFGGDARKSNVFILDERREVVDTVPPLIAQEIAPMLGMGARPTVELIQLNESPSPPTERLLVRIRGQWPDRYEPMQRVAFAPILI
jgi:hypothetical protein